MWALVKASQVIEIIGSPKNITVNNVAHPKGIFKSWTKANLKKIGIYEFISGSNPDNRFETGGDISYTVNDTKGTVTEAIKKKDRALEDVKVVDEKGKAILDEDGNQLITKGLKSVYIESIKQQANSSLAPSDWLVTRFVEDNTKKIPDDVKTYRKKVRDTSDSIITKIEAIKKLSDLKKLFDHTYNSDGTIKTLSTMDSMPKSTIKEYER